MLPQPTIFGTAPWVRPRPKPWDGELLGRRLCLAAITLVSLGLWASLWGAGKTVWALLS
jgi:hypothetical protein